jgi:hypothetical protein
MADSDVNLLFLPYHPGRKSRSVAKIGEGVSRQRHVAREYHRKVRLGYSKKAAPWSTASAPLGPGNASVLQKSNSDSSNPDHDFERPPISLLDASSGQLDPFNASIPCGANTSILNLLDYASSNQWKIFSNTNTVIDVGSIKSGVLASAMQSPVAFWALAFAGLAHSIYNAPLGFSQTHKDLRLSLKLKALQEMSVEVGKLQQFVSDDILMSMVTLAAHGMAEQLERPTIEEGVSRPILLTVQNFDYYGRIRCKYHPLSCVCKFQVRMALIEKEVDKLRRFCT